MKILKFGGTSLENSKMFLCSTKIIENNSKNDQIAVVLSAPGKITNFLANAIEKSIKNRNTLSEMSEIKNIFSKLITNIYQKNNNFPYNLVQEIIKKKLLKLQSLLNGISLLGKCPDSSRAKIICYGELLSVIIMKNVLKAKSYKITVIDPQENLLAIGDYLNSTVDIHASTIRINAMNISKHHIILMAGFIAGNKKNELVVLGRNGSDYSAAILSVCLKGKICEIWTDVDGIYTCDPKHVKDAKLLQSLSYQEATELSYFGAKVLHPKTIAPIAKFKIPCLIKNTKNPNAPGTIICENSNDTTFPIKGITYLNNITIIYISKYKIKNMITIASRIFSVLYSNQIEIILVTQFSSEFDISFCICKNNTQKTIDILETEFQLELKNKLLKPIKFIENLSILSIIGSGINTQKKFFSKIFSTLSKSNTSIFSISNESSKNSISIVLQNDCILSNIKAIHNSLFNNEKTIELFLIGIGGVGKTLLHQIKKQNNWLKLKNINIKICGIANSKKILCNINDGIDLNFWKKFFLETTKPFKINDLILLSKNNTLINPTIIDCTANQEIANQYSILLESGFNVITSNKKANTSNMQYYKKIRSSASHSKKKFLYETNVGAGLPIIENLKNLFYAGDELIHFRGILSGSLSFIFGQLEENIPLSEATKKAHELGFTEPNPKDDLSGIDVARKLLILAREIGLNLELENIKIEPILPETFNNISNTKHFMIKIQELDHIFSNRIKKAKKHGKTLRFVGIIEKNRTCTVKIEEVEKHDPLYEIKHGENALAFYSKYYHPIPLVLRGYGAGNIVTAAGVFSDILRILS
ncbi:MAG: bifunctional aspartate kinase/homoserine dehydrogenase I [Buchnera aphidicola (Nurudea yanoniella)]